MKRLWAAVVLSLGIIAAPISGAFAQIDMRQGQPGQQGQGPVLSPRDQGPPPPNVIPADTQFEVQLKDTLDTNKDNPGKKFKAKLAQDWVSPSGATIPMGSEVRG